MTDRIITTIFAEGAIFEEIASALEEYSQYVSAQTLTLDLKLAAMAEAPESAAVVEWGDGHIKINVNKTK